MKTLQNLVYIQNFCDFCFTENNRNSHLHETIFYFLNCFPKVCTKLIVRTKQKNFYRFSYYHHEDVENVKI